MRKTQWGGFVEVSTHAFPGGGNEIHFRIERCQIEQLGPHEFRLKYSATRYLNSWSLEPNDILLRPEMDMIQQDKVITLGVDDRLISIRVDGKIIYDRTNMAMKNEKTHAYQLLEQSKRVLTVTVEQLRVNQSELGKALEKTSGDLRTHSDKLSNVLETMRVLEDTGLMLVEEDELVKTQPVKSKDTLDLG